MTPISKVIFLGSKPLGLRVLKTIFRLRPESLEAIVTFDDTVDMRSDLTGFKNFSEHCGKPLFIARNAGDAEEIIKKLRPDLCLVVCWYWMLKDDLINSIPHGAIGVHNSLLPKYRGGSPLVWAILNGDEQIGFSVFSLTSEMDAGQIWFQEKLVLPEQIAVGEALNNIEVQLLKTLDSGWCSLLDGMITPQPQRHEEATYCAQRMPEDGKIDWTRGGKELVSFVNAQSAPYPGAYTILKNQKIIFSEAKLWPTPYFGIAGQIAGISEDGVIIICGDNRGIVVKTVIQDGVNRPAREVFTSIKIRL
jgi:methionyl-tRNA formyltransferase